VIERTGEVFEFDEKLTAVGRKLQVGDTAPDFELDHIDPESGTGSKVSLSSSAGKVRIINVINSIDTPVCHLETHRWEDARQSLPDDVVIYTVSMDLPFAQARCMDLPFAQARWNKNENVTHQALSSHKTEQFGQDYGVYLKEWRLLQRAVFVIGRDGKIAHVEYVNDQMQEPDYDAAIAATRKAAE
jgi:thioredoxin-dependent peroxiredoxin